MGTTRLEKGWRSALLGGHVGTLLGALFLFSQASVGVGCGDDSFEGGSGGDSGFGGTMMTDLCQNAVDCTPGHRCELPDVGGTSGSVVGGEVETAAQVEPVGTCSRECLDELCSPRACTSSTGTCGSPNCEDSSECAQLEFCESDSGTCRPSAGQCQVWQDCAVSQKVRGKATLSCDGSCQLTPQATATVAAPFAGEATLTVTSPTAGAIVQELSAVKFRFTRSAAHGFALIVPAPADAADDVRLEDAIWGAVLAPNAGSCTWADGSDVNDGAWQASLSDPPREGRYYFVVQAVSRGELVAFTDLSPFAVGPAALEPGDACEDEGKLAGECAHPERLMGCYLGRCTPVCASNAACAPLDCGDPVNGVRYCQ